MADISIKVPHKATAAKATEVVSKVLDKMSQNMGFVVDWEGQKASLSGTGLKKGYVEIDDTDIAVEINLALMAKPMKGMIEGKIRDAFEKRLG